ncbi:NAD-dependent succinate-semialdehyde dehydrogenase [Marinicella sp. S1101]|uniref:NAD-dependent succinate-semialdehyde dehydrogenase n=1 Tax=Marinicella marina TaxID=2996016 RepID=UPI0022608EAD|nr:NAD-dependent succinate-semialdehyde dehydrogenase [Marinicella marina]MCX7553442.1 NAD-dependent succinate-semialdehyde dehydrogenase [Marinicella marina]MDJ1140066.1 NAD-dependent succinate-semialdehyde dehydrogenase [Marinicella marina]
MADVKTTNPYNQEVLNTFYYISNETLEARIDDSHQAFLNWRETSLDRRAQLLNAAAKVLLKNKRKFAEHITQEMGKPISESVSEIEKCAWVCEFYAKRGAGFLAPKKIETDAESSCVRFDPIGAVLAVMPWNYPFWQVFRFAAPTLMAGNVGVLKHASNVLQCSQDIEDVFTAAGFPAGVFQSLVISHEQVNQVIKNPHIKAVTLTGSEKAGSAVAAAAGEHIKSSLLELGGSNAFVVLNDADIPSAAALAAKARFQNTGQSCIAAKRFIIEATVFDEFKGHFLTQVKNLNSGNPMDEDTKIGPMARVDLAEELNEQLQQAIVAGAKVELGGKHKGAQFEPTVVTNVSASMRIMQEETFGPLAPLMAVASREEALAIAADTPFGLGMTVCTQDIDFIERNIADIKDGAVFVNEMVKSDPRLPFGGTGISGYGRELAEQGIKAFVNEKTVYIKTRQHTK